MLRLTTAFVLALSTSVFAESFDTSVDFTKLDRNEFIEESRRMAKASWSTSMVIFTRIDPSIEEFVPDFPWSSEFEEGYGCLYDEMAGAGKLGQINEMRDEGVKFVDFLEKNPDASLVNLDQYDEAMDLMTPGEETIAAMQDCGLMKLNQNVMAQSGLMQAVMSAYAEQQQ